MHGPAPDRHYFRQQKSHLRPQRLHFWDEQLFPPVCFRQNCAAFAVDQIKCTLCHLTWAIPWEPPSWNECVGCLGEVACPGFLIHGLWYHVHVQLFKSWVKISKTNKNLLK